MAEGMNHYETVIIVSTRLGDEGQKALVEKFKERISRHGTVESVDEWGKRRLAYPIEKETEGYYTLINFECTPDFTAELDRRYGITDGLLRSIIIKKDPRHIAADQKRKERQQKAAEAAAAAAAEKATTVDVEAVAAESMMTQEAASATENA